MERILDFAVFVYGTLKRGECRASQWPRTPRDVLKAEVAGALYDLGPYPALVDGPDRVLGELWVFDRTEEPLVLATLDAIEHYQQRGPDLYIRVERRCETSAGHEPRMAWLYHYARPRRLTPSRRVTADATGCCVWRHRDVTSRDCG